LVRVYKVIVRVSDYPLSDESLCEGRKLGYEVAVIDSSGRYLFTRKVCRAFVDDHELTGYAGVFLDAKAVVFRKDTVWIYVYERLYEEEE
jgi:hypothetical protein